MPIDSKAVGKGVQNRTLGEFQDLRQNIWAHVHRVLNRLWCGSHVIQVLKGFQSCGIYFLYKLHSGKVTVSPSRFISHMASSSCGEDLAIQDSSGEGRQRAP